MCEVGVDILSLAVLPSSSWSSNQEFCCCCAEPGIWRRKKEGGVVWVCSCRGEWEKLGVERWEKSSSTLVSRVRSGCARVWGSKNGL